MNVAIVIGVSRYSNPNDNLPGSKNDAESIYTVLDKTEKFDVILYINDDQNSAETKTLITNFISEHKGRSIEELFFYYSGHGEFTNDEFYYILSDFDSKKRNQTSLQNKEIDDLIKTLSPLIVVKVIDACQSGAFYIKEIGILNKYFSDSQKGFQKCYFFNSSLNSQSSYADNKISFFTASFINAIKEHKSEEIRYKDIIDVISDEFSTNQEQTPLFVIQADLTEKFCFINQRLRDYLSKNINLEDGLKQEENKSLSLSELVKLDAQNYTNKEGAIKTLKLIQSTISSFKLNGTLKDLYETKIEFWDDYIKIVDKHTVKKWLDKNDHDYFVTYIYENEYDDYNGMHQSLVGFDLNIEAPFKSVLIDFVALYPNILSYHSEIIYFISKKFIRFFYFTTSYIEKDWETKEINFKELKWFTTEYKIGVQAEAIDGANKMLMSIQNHIEKSLEEKFNPEEEDPDLPF